MQIRESEIDFWQDTDADFQKMRLRHKSRMYPPRVQMTVTMESMDYIKLPITFEGCSSDSQLNMELIFPMCKQYMAYTVGQLVLIARIYYMPTKYLLMKFPSSTLHVYMVVRWPTQFAIWLN